MAARKGATLAGIAKLANVSRSTVSMILNGRQDVSFSQERVKRVREAAFKLGYTRASRDSRTDSLCKNTILIICPNISNPYYSTLVQSTEQAARAKNFNTLIYNTYRDGENETQILSAICNLAPAGIIFTFIPNAAALVEKISQSIPVVMIGDHSNAISIDTIELNNYNAGVLIARHMLELGHRHIAYISTTLDNVNIQRRKRLDGIMDTFKAQGEDYTVMVKSKELTPADELGDIHIEHTVGYELARQCISDPKLTAFVAVNDMVAYGIMDFIISSGYRIPEDYSVCGFDNIFPSGFSNISLTTVEHYIAEKGHNAFNLLCEKIARADNTNKPGNRITRVEYLNHLIVRGSTAKPRQTASKD